MTIQIRYWWPGYSPEEALDSFDPVVQETPFDVSRDGGWSWRAPRPGTTLQTLREWMIDSDLRVLKASIADTRRNGGRWEGRYVLTLGPKNGGGERCTR